MAEKPDYTGTHKVVLPADFLNSIDAAVELYEEEIAMIAADLNVAGMRARSGHRVLAVTIGLLIWLLPADWMMVFN